MRSGICLVLQEGGGGVIYRRFLSLHPHISFGIVISTLHLSKAQCSGGILALIVLAPTRERQPPLPKRLSVWLYH